jgi:hypothetical protein
MKPLYKRIEFDVELALSTVVRRSAGDRPYKDKGLEAIEICRAAGVEAKFRD